jgi:hypothetical protein
MQNVKYSFLASFPYFEKIKGSLRDHLSVSVNFDLLFI